MRVAWLFRAEFGVFLLLFAALLARQLRGRFAAWGGFKTFAARRNAESWLLFLAALAIAARYGWALLTVAGRMPMPPIETGLLFSFAAVCAMYLRTKAMRALRKQN